MCFIVVDKIMTDIGEAQLKKEIWVSHVLTRERIHVRRKPKTSYRLTLVLIDNGWINNNFILLCSTVLQGIGDHGSKTFYLLWLLADVHPLLKPSLSVPPSIHKSSAAKWLTALPLMNPMRVKIYKSLLIILCPKFQLSFPDSKFLMPFSVKLYMKNFVSYS